MKKSLSFVLAFVFACSLMTPAFAAEYVDVPDDAWYIHVLRCAEDLGMVQGDGNGHFYPDAPVTMAQVYTMLGRVFSEADGVGYDEYIDWALENGYVDKAGFNPDATISVEQFAVLISDFMDKSGVVPVYYWMDSVYVDGDDVADNAKDSVARLMRYGFLVVGEDSKVHPQKLVTRAECMTTVVFYAMSLKPVNSAYSYVEGY